MRFLAIASFALMFISLPTATWEGEVMVDSDGVYHLRKGEKPKEWSYPIRGYILGKPIRYSDMNKQALEDIPGVGPSLASKLMLLREEKPSATWSDIDAVSGIGKKKLVSLQKTLSLSD